MVAEGEVLLRVQHLQHGGSGIAPEIVAHFVDLVEQEHGVHGARPLHALDDAARDGPHIGAPVAADLGLVPHAAQAHLHELAAHGLGDALHDAGFAHAGRAHEAQDGALQHAVLGVPFLHAAHGQVFDHPLLHLFHGVVILVQDAAGALEVQVVRGQLAPGQVQNPFHIGAADADFRRAGGHAGKPVQFLVGLFPGLVVHGRVGNLFAQVLHIGFVLVAQFFLDGLDLLPQIIVLLVFVDLLFQPALHLLFDARQLGFPDEDFAQLFQPLFHVDFL